MKKKMMMKTIINIRINDAEKEIVRMSNTVNNVKSTINEVIASGIKQEIISTLQ